MPLGLSVPQPYARWPLYVPTPLCTAASMLADLFAPLTLCLLDFLSLPLCLSVSPGLQLLCYTHQSICPLASLSLSLGRSASLSMNLMSHGLSYPRPLSLNPSAPVPSTLCVYASRPLGLPVPRPLGPSASLAALSLSISVSMPLSSSGPQTLCPSSSMASFSWELQPLCLYLCSSASMPH